MMSLRAKQISVSCPEDQGGCGASPGKPCVYKDTGKPQRGVHGVRELLAFEIQEPQT